MDDIRSGNCFYVTGSVAINGDAPVDDTDARALQSAMFMLSDEHDPVEIFLVHGIVTRQSDGCQHCHSWMEVQFDDNTVVVLDFANGLRIAMLAPHYYKGGKISQAKRYSVKEAITEMSSTGHYGPWEIDVT